MQHSVVAVPLIVNHVDEQGFGLDIDGERTVDGGPRSATSSSVLEVNAWSIGAASIRLGDSLQVLHHIDTHGRTVLNSFQAGLLAQDIDKVVRDLGDRATELGLIELRDLAERCAAMAHTFLQLEGD